MILALLALSLFILSIRNRDASLIESSLWSLQQSGHLKTVILDMVVASLAEFLAFVLVGFLAVRAFSTENNKSVFTISRLVPVLLVGIGLSAILSTAASGPGLRLPILMDMLVPSTGALLGGWIGVGWVAEKTARRWVVVKLAYMAIASVALLMLLLFFAIESRPLGFAPVELTSAERVRIVTLVRSKSPRAISEGQTNTLSLTEKDINLLLTWGLSLGSADRKARIDLDDRVSTLRVSVRLPGSDRSPQYLNLVVAGLVRVEDGTLSLRIDELRIGDLGVARPILWVLSSGLAAKIRREPLAIPILRNIRRTEITADYMSVTYGRIDMPEGFRDDIFGSIGPEDRVYAALAAQFEQIKKIGATLSARPERLEVFLRASFRLASERSIGGDPVLENRAAIIALGIALGHDFIGEFLGSVPYENIPRMTPPLTRRVHLRGRVDWSRHFLVSAALEVLSTEALSHDVGLLKEELDAGSPGGSGFSFADLAADRSGTQFGKIATQDEESARAIQRLMLEDVDVDAYFPEISDLPENISEQRLETEYGGVNGEKYLLLIEEIDRRINERLFYQ